MSDENSCEIIEYDDQEVYRKNFPSMTRNDKLNVTIDIFIDAIDHIDINMMRFWTKVIVKLTWRDQRLVFKNLNEQDNRDSFTFQIRH